jgi:penicillin amidase
MRWRVLRILPILLLLLLVAAASGYLWLRSSLPLADGRLALPGLSAEVRITRDAHGVPTITAQNDRDAAFALGFLHAQDRLFQMDLMRHFGAGRLSEWFGTRTLASDRSMRVLGLYRAAERQYAVLSPAVRGVLDAYAAGVNAYLDERRALPPEYDVVGVTPEPPWRPADTLVWGKIMDLALTGNYRGELLRARLLQRLSPADLAILYPAYPASAPVTLRDVQAALRGLPLDRIYASLPEGGPQRASNNWVVSGARTVSGKPLLANDPHLDFSAPGVWYLARIETPKGTLAGVTAPGTPFVILGHNERIAWGFTTTGSDVEDVFVEKLDPADPHRYMTPEGPAPFITRQEVIKVRGGAPVVMTVRATRHGPVISDIAGKGATAGPGDVLSLAATWLADDDRSPQAIWDMAQARNWTEFRAALRNMAAPQQNIVYADVDGNIGFIAPARVPIRAKGNGWLPVPGWSGEYDWKGYVPFDALPTAYNPPSGRVVTANNKIVPDNYPYFFGRDWDYPNRAERITTLLDRTQRQSLDGSAVIQADTVSLMARRLLPLLLAAKPDSSRAEAAVARLSQWDGRMDRDEVAPLLFVAWLRELGRTILADRLGPAFHDYWGLHPDVMRLILTEHQTWCDDVDTPAVETCTEVIGASLDRALDDLTRRYGAQMDDWRWGRVHEAVFRNALWSNVPVLRDWFTPRIPADGGTDTVDAGAFSIRDAAAPFADVHGPTLRMIVDLAAPEKARFMIAPGQSGNPLSAHYSDLLEPWRDVDYLTFSADASGGTLVLEPR